MGFLTVVDLMSLLVIGLLVVSIVTPSAAGSARARRY